MNSLKDQRSIRGKIIPTIVLLQTKGGRTHESSLTFSSNIITAPQWIWTGSRLKYGLKGEKKKQQSEHDFSLIIPTNAFWSHFLGEGSTIYFICCFSTGFIFVLWFLVSWLLACFKNSSLSPPFESPKSPSLSVISVIQHQTNLPTSSLYLKYRTEFHSSMK